MNKRRAAAIVCFLLLLQPFIVYSASCTADKAGIQKTLEEYRVAWLSNDENRVMRTLSDGAILMPASAKAEIVGSKAIREYWWPAGSPFSIDEFDQSLVETDSCSDLGYVRGTSRVAWTSMNNGVQTKSESSTNFLAILKKDHGSWFITRLTWYQTN